MHVREAGIGGKPTTPPPPKPTPAPYRPTSPPEGYTPPASASKDYNEAKKEHINYNNHVRGRGTQSTDPAPTTAPASGPGGPQGNWDVGGVNENDKKITELKEKIAELKKKAKASKEKIKEYEKQLETQKAEQQKAKEKVEAEKEKLAQLEENYEKNKEKYEAITKQIEEATKNLEANLGKKQQDAIFQAMVDYNEAEDGDWNEYLEEKLAQISPDLAKSNLIGFLKEQNKELCIELAKNRVEISAQKEVVTKAENAYTAISDTVRSAEKLLKTENETLDGINKEIDKINNELKELGVEIDPDEEEKEK